MLTKEQRLKNKSKIFPSYKVVYQRKGEDYTRDGYVNAPDEEEAGAMFLEMLENQNIEAEIVSVKEEDDY